MIDQVWLMLALPLAGAVALLLAGKPLRRVAGGLGSATVGAAFVVAVLVYRDLVALGEGERTVLIHVFDWITVGSFRAPVELRVDQLSVVMTLTVTGVGFLIHVYSIGYMHGDPRYSRFFGYMNLFVASMLTLVLANNFVVMYVGWEGVGLCSYLLIAFWFERKVAADAGKKAFIVTRIGDTALLIGIFLIFSTTGSVEFDAVFGRAAGLSAGVTTAISLLLLGGAVGKSAQMPLHTWLPDAMAGPTPVSALIHAATMVTAGVYLVARTHPLFEASGAALTVVAVIGTVTLIYAALSAIGQDDLKRVLAYSTISQLGYMFLAAGVGAFAVAIFHLVMHAFFKAAMFLSAGSVMHATDGEIDMTRLGGLRRAMPVTAAVFGIGGLALAGIPPLAGFFSKDQILASAYDAGRVTLWLVGLVSAGFTALYAARAMGMTFFGTSRFEGHPHESPRVMTVPMGILAGLAAVGGLLGLSVTTGAIQTFLAPVFGGPEAASSTGGLSEVALSVLASAVALGGLALGWYLYISGRVSWRALRKRWAGPHRVLLNGFYVDETYGRFIVRPARSTASFMAFVVDAGVIDGVVNGTGRLFRRLAAVGRRVQTGMVRRYALGFLVGAVGVLAFLAVRS